MKIAADACTLILLAKASVLEKGTEAFKVTMTAEVYEEVLKGKGKMAEDAFLIERLEKEKKITVVRSLKKMTEELIKNFEMGKGEASVISLALEEKGMVIATDNRQGRKVAKINNLNLVGSLELVVALFKKGKITSEKALSALKVLETEGWFDDYLIEKTKEDIK
ncbi:MAG: hypothetical protein WC595_01265 [Candidatus Nanoarchaeia archaeon]